MTVAELITELQKVSPDLPVYRRDASYEYVCIDEVDTQKVIVDNYNPATRATPTEVTKIEAVVLG